MSHLSSPMSIAIMIFYSILTFFVGPYITSPFFKDPYDKCVAGFLVGFTISILLWIKVGKNYAK
jgi:hypothetical protein